MPYQPFALKYRPQTFEQVIGQAHVAQTLRNAVAQGRVPHAYLFAGPRGTGKTSSARVLAKALNCVHGPTPDPCGECAACLAIQAGRFLDVVEIDAASHRGIDDVRDLCEKVKYGPAEGRCKVYILDEAHQITGPAANALLKTLEEPPGYVYFILATTAAHSILPTIKSRCQCFDFRTIQPAQIVETLRGIAAQEQVEIEEPALWLIAEAAGGALRDAETIFDQVVAFGGQTVGLEQVREALGLTQRDLLEQAGQLLAQGDMPGVFALVDRLVTEGKDLPQFLKDLTNFLRDSLRVTLGAPPPGWEAVGPEQIRVAQEVGETLGTSRLRQVIETLRAALERLSEGAAEMLTVELALAQAALPPTAPQAPAVAPAAAVPPAAAAVPPAAVASAAPTAAPGPPSTPTPVAPTAPAAPPPTSAPPARSRRAPAAPSGPLTLEIVAGQWEAAMEEELKRMRHLSAWALAREARPVAVEGDVVHLVFPDQCRFHHGRVQEDYLPVLQEALQRLLGQAVRMRCHLGEAPPIAAPAPAPGDAAPTATGEPEAPAPAATEEPSVAAAAEEGDTEVKPEAAVHQAVAEALSLFEGSRELPEG